MEKDYTTVYNLIIECCRQESDTILLENYASKIEDWDIFLDSVYMHGVLPLVYKTLKTSSFIPENVKLYLRSANFEIARRNMIMTAELLRIIKLLEKNGIQALAIKGPVLSQIAYGDIIQRQFSDLDILIQQNDLYKAVELLCAKGFISEQPIKFLRNPMLLKVAKDFLIYNKKKNIHIELHWKLFDGRLFKKSNIPIFHEALCKCTLQGHTINTLNKEVQILYLILHGSKHMWERLEWITDINYLIDSEKNVNWKQILIWAEIMKIMPMVYLGIMICNKIFQTPFPSYVMDGTQKYTNIHRAVNLLVKKIYNNSILNPGEYMINYYYLGIKNSKPIVSKLLSRFYKPSAREIYHINFPGWLSPLYYFILFVKVLYTQLKLYFWKK